MPQVSSLWPDDCRGAVSLTFDDGMKSQLELAAPMLNDFGLSGTFYLNPRGCEERGGETPSWRELLAPWKKVAAIGHEIGNHTVNHPCSWAFRDNRDSGLERMTIDDIEAEITEGKRRIEAAMPDQGVNSFCYPCYHSHIGEGPTRQSYVPAVARHHPAGRAKGDYANHPETVDLHHLFSRPVERHDSGEMIGFIEQAMATGKWAILTMHGIHEGHLAVSDVALKDLCCHLARNSDRILVGTVVSVAQRIRDWRKERYD